MTRELGTRSCVCYNKSNYQTPGSNAFVPSVAGLIIAAEVADVFRE